MELCNFGGSGGKPGETPIGTQAFLPSAPRVAGWPSQRLRGLLETSHPSPPPWGRATGEADDGTPAAHGPRGPQGKRPLECCFAENCCLFSFSPPGNRGLRNSGLSLGAPAPQTGIRTARMCSAQPATHAGCPWAPRWRGGRGKAVGDSQGPLRATRNGRLGALRWRSLPSFPMFVLDPHRASVELSKDPQGCLGSQGCGARGDEVSCP